MRTVIITAIIFLCYSQKNIAQSSVKGIVVNAISEEPLNEVLI